VVGLGQIWEDKRERQWDYVLAQDLVQLAYSTAETGQELVDEWRVQATSSREIEDQDQEVVTRETAAKFSEKFCLRDETPIFL
jgi:hypothetical protein